MVTIYPNMEDNYKLIEFILNNNLMNKGAINRKTLIKLTKDEGLSLEEQSELIRTFCTLNYSFYDYDTELFRNSIKCVLSSIKCDPNSVQEIPSFFEVGYMDKILASLNEDYYITKDTPKYLRGIYKLALRSIEKDIFSVDYLNYDCLTKKERDDIVNIICSSSEYYINENTPFFLKNNADVTNVSYKNNPNSTIKYCDKRLIPYEYILDMIGKVSISDLDLSLLYLKNKEIVKKLFSYKGKETFDIEKYNDRVATLISKAMSKPLSIKNIYEYGRVVGYMKMKNDGETGNPFALISSCLRSDKSYEDIISDLAWILNDIEYVLDDKSETLYMAIEKYYELYHSNGNSEKQNKYLSLLSSICSLYHSKCIENKLDNGFKIVKNRLSDYFILRKDNKSVISYIMSKRYIKTVKKFFISGKFDDFSNYLKEKYGDSKLIDELFDSVCKYDSFCVYGEPTDYSNYLISKETNKLVNRLNSGYIKYTDKDVERYKELIEVDEQDNKTLYKNKIAFLLDNKACKEYEKKYNLAHEIRKEIILKAKEVNEDNEIFDNQLKDIDNSIFSFNDTFYLFNSIPNEGKYIKNLIESKYEDICGNIKLPLPFSVDDILDDEKYNALTKFLCDSGAFYLFFFYSIGCDECLSYKYLLSFGMTYDFLKKIGIYDINYFNLITAFNIINNCSKDKLAILEDMEVVQKIIYSTEYTDDDAEERIRIASDLVVQMADKNESTVPYIKGSIYGYNYSLYDSQDPSILLSGIDTDACFKVCGNDNDFLHYCAINKNGFVLKITDNEGKFIARAAGLRHGNSIYFNQFRTIYDVSLNRSLYTDSELNELRKVMFKAAEDFINISKVTEPSDNQIEYVFITKSYGFNTYNHNVGSKLRDIIGELSFIEETEDFKEFHNNTSNLYDEGLETDYIGTYSLICLASQFEPNNKNMYDGELIKNYDAKAYYKRPRTEIIIEKDPSEKLIRKVNKIRAINSLYEGEMEYEEYIPDTDDVVAVGDNWYLIWRLDNSEVVLLPNDEDAISELKATIKSLIDDYKEGEGFSYEFIR